MIARSTLDAHHVHVRGDNAWQQRARLQQALWRERESLPIGLHNGAPLGSRLDSAAGDGLQNYLSAQASSQVHKAVRDAPKTGAFLSRPRLWADLLSSQPLCFNLFGPLADDSTLATAILQLLWPEIRAVREIRFEWSPGRGDDAYTGNRSAFDVFVDYDGDLGRSFLGIEVKYHEDLTGTAAPNKDGWYERIADRHGVFRPESFAELSKLPLQQIWLDHLLALQMLAKPDDGWDAATFVLLHPVGNVACAKASARYRRCLTDSGTFDVRTLDDVVQAARMVTADPWPTAVNARYLDPAPVNAVAGLQRPRSGIS